MYIGPSDLSVSIGGSPGGDQRAPDVMNRIEQTLEACHRHGIKAGIHAMSSDYANEMLEKGFDLVTLSSDFRHMLASANAMLANTKWPGMRWQRDTRKMKENFNRRREDIGNVIVLEHINLCVPDHQLATLFYISGLGLTRDLSCYKRGKICNIGRNQFHPPTRDPS